MVNYTRLAATAERLIEASGRSVTFRKRDRTPASGSEPWFGPDDVPTPTDGASVTAIAVFVPPGSGLGQRVIVDGGLAETYDRELLVAQDSLPSGTDLAEFDTVDDGSEAWQIARTEPLQPGSVRLIYAMGLRG